MYDSPYDVIKNAYTIDELNDIVEHGCASGCAHQHIYYADNVSFYDEYEHSIVDYITDAIGSEFLTETFDNNEGHLIGYKNDIVWTFIELYAMELIDNINNEELEEDNKQDLNLNDLLSTNWGESHLEIVNG